MSKSSELFSSRAQELRTPSKSFCINKEKMLVFVFFLKALTQFLPDKLGLFGFVFLCPADQFFNINSFHIVAYADLVFIKLALFFQIPSRNTQHGERGTNKLALFFQISVLCKTPEFVIARPEGPWQSSVL